MQAGVFLALRYEPGCEVKASLHPAAGSTIPLQALSCAPVQPRSLSASAVTARPLGVAWERSAGFCLMLWNHSQTDSIQCEAAGRRGEALAKESRVVFETKALI